MKSTCTQSLFSVALLGVLAAPGARAQPPQPAADAKTPAAPASEKPQGLLPLPDYSGGLWERRFLSGDWGGARNDLANHGVQFDVNFTQVVQSVVEGGRDNGARYGGGLDYNLNFDLMRMGVLPGALVKVRAESKYGRTVNGMAGPILAVNSDGYFPVTPELDDNIPITVTDLVYTQFLSEKFAVLAGKFDTLDSDLNEFSSGRGTSQFLNTNFLFSPALALVAPYSTLGVGVVWLPTKNISVSSLLYNSADSSTTSGFQDVGDGTSWATEARFQYRLGDLPGGQNVGLVYSFDNDFTKLGGDFVFQPGQGLTPTTKSDTWAAYWSGWQYLYVKDPSDAPIDLSNGMADHQGVGLFARFGLADHSTNPIEWSASGGVGGRGIIPSRDNDSFGVGYYYSKAQEGRLSGLLGIATHTQGFEAYYALAITPAANLTFDVQVADSLAPAVDTAVILGMRLGLRF